MNLEDPYNDQPVIDGEVVSEDPVSPRNRPEWRVWSYFGAEKAAEAARVLEFEGERDGLFHYRDWRDNERYTLPVIAKLDRFRKEQTAANHENQLRWPRWRRIGGLWALATVVLFIWSTTMVDTGSDDNRNTGMLLLKLSIVSIVAGPMIIGAIIVVGRVEPTPLPAHRMFYTDAEIEQAERDRQRQQAMAAVATTAYFAHKYVQHQRHELAKDIAKQIEASNHHQSPSNWW
jgi:hypothetical protein